jgi:hypothetical protein
MHKSLHCYTPTVDDDINKSNEFNKESEEKE